MRVDGSKERASDFLQLDASRVPRGGRADWLTGELRRALADGRLPVGSRLPATRVLAVELQLSRGVVSAAYQRLRDDGQLGGERRGGTVVLAVPAIGPAGSPAGGAGPAGRPGPDPFAVRAPDRFEALRTAACELDLAPGRPDLTAFPRAAWLRAERAVLARLTPNGFGYSDPRGTPALRTAVARWVGRSRGIRVDPADVIIVAGTSQAFALLAQVLVARGVDTIAMEDPGSAGARDQLRAWGVTTVPVPLDDEGLRVDALETSGARAVLVTPAHQFPTGVVLSAGRRRELLAWAANGLVIEDDYDAEHRYDRAPVPALRSMDAERICYCGSVSKLLAPALRTGWLIAPRDLQDDLVARKRNTDLGNPALVQLGLAELMDSGDLERHLRHVRRRHRRRRDAMLTALATRLPTGRVQGAAAGLHLVVTLPDDVDDTALAAAAFADGVKVHPLSWHRQRDGTPGLVFGYAAGSVSEIERGVAVVGAAYARLTPGRGGAC